eukprot:3484166-Alexandrium_andersonii.AAC.1
MRRHRPLENSEGTQLGTPRIHGVSPPSPGPGRGGVYTNSLGLRPEPGSRRELGGLSSNSSEALEPE